VSPHDYPARSASASDDDDSAALVSYSTARTNVYLSHAATDGLLYERRPEWPPTLAQHWPHHAVVNNALCRPGIVVGETDCIGGVTAASPAVSGALILDGCAVIGTVSDDSAAQEAFHGLLRLPDWLPEPSPQLRRMLREIRDWTGWSQRHLASHLGTTHPTVRRLEEEGASPRSVEAAARIPPLHNVIKRLFSVVGGDVRRLAQILAQPAVSGGLSPSDYLIREDYAKAYRAALRNQAGDSQTGMLVPPAGAVRLDGTHSSEGHD